jgi:hypothetical protein
MRRPLLTREALIVRFGYSEIAGTQIGGLFVGRKKWPRWSGRPNIPSGQPARAHPEPDRPGLNRD